MSDKEIRKLERDALSNRDIESGIKLLRKRCQSGQHFWSEWRRNDVDTTWKGIRQTYKWECRKLAESLGFEKIDYACSCSRKCFVCGFEQRKLLVQHHKVYATDSRQNDEVIF